MRARSLVLIVLTVLLTDLSCLRAQVRPQFSMTADYDLFINPSRAGADTELRATAAHRSQYVGLGGRAISTQYLGVHAPIASPSFGVGLHLVNDRIGLQRFTAVTANGAWHVDLGDHRLSTGLGVGIVQMSLDGAALRAPDGTYDGGIDHVDDVLPEEQVGGAGITADVGVSIRFDWGTTLGVTVLNIPNAAVALGGSGTETKTRLGRTIYLHGEHVLDLTDDIGMTFFAAYKTDLVEHQTHLRIRTDIKKVWIGAGYRGFSAATNDALLAQFGFTVRDRVDVGYGYDIGLSGLATDHSGSHEIRVRYVLPIGFTPRRPAVNHDPRYL